MSAHEWIRANLGHSTLVCQHCGCTPKEAEYALGMECPKAAAPQAPPDVVEIMAIAFEASPCMDTLGSMEAAITALQAAGFVIRKDGK